MVNWINVCTIDDKCSVNFKNVRVILDDEDVNFLLTSLENYLFKKLLREYGLL